MQLSSQKLCESLAKPVLNTICLEKPPWDQRPLWFDIGLHFTCIQTNKNLNYINKQKQEQKIKETSKIKKIKKSNIK